MRGRMRRSCWPIAARVMWRAPFATLRTPSTSPFGLSITGPTRRCTCIPSSACWACYWPGSSSTKPVASAIARGCPGYWSYWALSAWPECCDPPSPKANALVALGSLSKPTLTLGVCSVISYLISRRLCIRDAPPKIILLQIVTTKLHAISSKLALGYSQGGFSTKVHLRAEGQGKPMVIVLTPGQQHEAMVFETLMEQGVVRRPGRGRPRRRPRRVIGDKGYSARRIRGYLRRRGMRITLPPKCNEGRNGPFDRVVYRTRNRIERLINRCKQFRRLATRYEKRAANYRTMWLIAVCLLWL